MAPEQLIPQGSARTEGADSSAADLEKRLEKMLRSVRKANRTVLIVGIILALVIGLYLHVLLSEVNSYLGEPTQMAKVATGLLLARIPGVSESLEVTLKRDADKIVAQLRAKVVEGLPALRKELETRAVKVLARELTGLIQARLDNVMKDMLRNDKEKLQPLIAKAARKGGAQALTAEFVKVFDEGLGKPLREELEKRHNRDLRMMLAKLRRLRLGRNLSDDEKYEKRLVTDVVKGLADLMVEAGKPKPAKKSPAAKKSRS